MIERWEKGGELKKVKGCGREERRQERETDSMTRDGREGGEREDGRAKKLKRQNSIRRNLRGNLGSASF